MRLALLVFLALIAGCAGCVSVPSHEALRATTLRLTFTDGVCSGTAIGPDLILSATHCFRTGLLVAVNGQRVKVIGRGQNKFDTTTVRVAGVRFDRWARLGPSPRQGDRVRWWGNPNMVPDVYREGYVSRAWTDGIVVDATICKGDSGAGLFNDNGRVVGVVTGMNDLAGCTFMVSLPMGADA